MQKKKSDRAHRPLAELSRGGDAPGDILAARDSLVSARCGVVRVLERVPKDPTEPLRPYIVRSELANHRFAHERDSEEFTCAGKGTTLEAATASALGEAVERYSSAYWYPEEVVYARRGDLDGKSLDPRDLVLYRAEQYDQLPYDPYADTSVLGWVPSRSLVDGSEVYVPALAVFMSYHPVMAGERLTMVTSNGLAAGPTLLDAVLGGLLEVLERDAFLITWMNRLPTRRVDAATHPDRDVVELWRAYRRRGVDVHLVLLPTDHPAHVFMAVAAQRGDGDGPARVVGLGADLDAARAARKAVLELGQVRPTLRMKSRETKVRDRIEALVADPELVDDLDDHDLLYCDPRTAAAFDFLLDAPVVAPPWPGPPARPPGDALVHLVESLAPRVDVLSCDLTPPEMAGLGLHTARVIVPGFQPIHFGAREPRLGGERLYTLPFELGLTDAPTTPESLNPYPHPLA